MDANELRPLDATSAETVAAGLGGCVESWSGADVVAIGWTGRTVRELHHVAHGLIRVLVERLGFGSVLIEGDRETSRILDAVIGGGYPGGDVRATVAGARPFLASSEMADLVLWLRHWNQTNHGDRVRIVHHGVDDLSSPQALERSLAEQVISWHQQHGGRIVYLGGAFHTAVAAQRTTALGDGDPVATAGSLLHGRFGHRYLSIGLTFGSGAIPQAVPPPPTGSLEARLDALGHTTVLVPMAALDDDRSSATRPDRVRFVGPAYDGRNDADHAMVGAPSTWFDHVVHQRAGTAVTFLT